jgi:HD-GYP domain-containing protein (c-di-GMP phosphodiesterase class II)
MNNLIDLRNFLSSLSYALDLTEGQPMGHCIRGCWLAVHIANLLNLDQNQKRSVYFTLLLKDSGCSSNAARLCELYSSDDRLVKENFKYVDSDDFIQVLKFVIKNTGMSAPISKKFKSLINLAKNGDMLANEMIMTRCERGAQIARDMNLDESVANGIYSLDEHFNGKGRPNKLEGKQIPLESRIALLCQCADVFNNIGGRATAIEHIKKRSGTWFDPEIVDAFVGVAKNDEVWDALTIPPDMLEKKVYDLLPANPNDELDRRSLNQVVGVFGKVIDAKSPFTAEHSKRVGKYALILGKKAGFSQNELDSLYHAAVLHDIGKLGISNTILDKPGKLSESEWEIMRTHPNLSENIISRLQSFEAVAVTCGAHHEKLDGTGYHRGRCVSDIDMHTRIITICDIYDALTADRPYRDAMPLDKAICILSKMKECEIDGDLTNLLIENIS